MVFIISTFSEVGSTKLYFCIFNSWVARNEIAEQEEKIP